MKEELELEYLKRLCLRSAGKGIAHVSKYYPYEHTALVSKIIHEAVELINSVRRNENPKIIKQKRSKYIETYIAFLLQL